MRENSNMIYVAFAVAIVLSLFVIGHRQEQRSKNSPDPWNLRDDWRTFRSKQDTLPVSAWISLFLGTAMVLTTSAFAAYTAKIKAIDSDVLFALTLLGGIGLIVAIKPLLHAIRFLRFGVSEARLDQVPFHPGERAAGTLRLPTSLGTPSALEATLRCYEFEKRGKSSTQITLWQEKKSLSLEARMDTGEFRWEFTPPCPASTHLACYPQFGCHAWADILGDRVSRGRQWT